MDLARALTKRYKPHDGANVPASTHGVTSPNRTVSRRHKDSNASTINRAQISLPIELISTTNVLAYNAPDIYPQQQQQQSQSQSQPQQQQQVLSPAISNPESSPSTASSASSTRSYEDSDKDSAGTIGSSITTPDFSREGSPATFTDKSNPIAEYFSRTLGASDSSSAASSPIDKPEGWFDKESKTSTAAQSQQQQQQQSQQQQPLSKLATNMTVPTVTEQLATPQSPAPVVPSRALSHTKKTHQAAARRRSRSRTSDPINAAAAMLPPLSPTNSNTTASSTPTSETSAAGAAAASASTSGANNSSSSAQRTSQEMFANRMASSAHPFGAELAQVKELAEEFGVKDVRVWNEEEQFLQDHGLCKFGVEDYLSEIRPLFAGVFGPLVVAEGSLLEEVVSEEEEGQKSTGGGDRAADCFATGTAWF